MKAKLVKESLNEGISGGYSNERPEIGGRYSSGKLSRTNAFTDFEKERSINQRQIGEVDPSWLTPLKKFTALLKATTNPEMFETPKLLAKYGFDIDDPDYEGKVYQEIVDMYNKVKRGYERDNERAIYLKDRYDFFLNKYGLNDIVEN